MELSEYPLDIIKKNQGKISQLEESLAPQLLYSLNQEICEANLELKNQNIHQEQFMSLTVMRVQKYIQVKQDENKQKELRSRTMMVKKIRKRKILQDSLNT